MIAEAGWADAGAFLTRLLRLDPAAVVRLRPLRLYPGLPSGTPLVELWAHLPFDVLVLRVVPAAAEFDDRTVEAAQLLRSLGGAASLSRRDQQWRWPLPSSLGNVVESIPERAVLQVASAASRTLKEAVTQGVGGRRVGERILRDALLDHVPFQVTGPAGERVEVPQRLVQAMVRMGFLRVSSHTPDSALTEGDTSVTVRLAGRWISLDGSYGSAWYLPVSPLRLS